MKRILFAAAVGVAVAGSPAAANGFGAAPMPAGPPPGMYGQPPEAGPCKGRFGWNPMFKKLLWWKKDACSDGGPGGAGAAAAGMGGQPQGTLVFPNHPFNRSPRDYFMLNAR